MKLTFKNISNTILIILIVSIIVLLLGNKCGNETKLTHSNKDSLNTIIAEKEQIAEYAMSEKRIYMAKFDSLLKVKPRYVKGRDRTHDSLIFVSDSICINSLNLLYKECQKVDSVNNSIIDTQTKVIQNDSTIITNYIQISNNYKMIIKSDSLTIDDLTMTVKKEKRKGKWNIVKASIIGLLGGGLIGSLR